MSTNPHLRQERTEFKDELLDINQSSLHQERTSKQNSAKLIHELIHQCSNFKSNAKIWTLLKKKKNINPRALIGFRWWFQATSPIHGNRRCRMAFTVFPYIIIYADVVINLCDEIFLHYMPKFLQDHIASVKALCFFPSCSSKSGWFALWVVVDLHLTRRDLLR